MSQKTSRRFSTHLFILRQLHKSVPRISGLSVEKNTHEKLVYKRFFWHNTKQNLIYWVKYKKKILRETPALKQNNALEGDMKKRSTL